MWATVAGVLLGISILLGLPAYFRWERRRQTGILLEREIHCSPEQRRYIRRWE